MDMFYIVPHQPKVRASRIADTGGRGGGDGVAAGGVGDTCIIAESLVISFRLLRTCGGGKYEETYKPSEKATRVCVIVKILQ